MRFPSTAALHWIPQAGGAEQMTPRLLHPAMRLVLGYLLLTVIVLLLNEYMGHSLRNHVFVGGATIFSTYVYLRYLRLDKRILSTLDLIDRHAILLLAVWIIIYLTWCGLVLFTNPFRFELNQGDAVFYVQTLWNLVNGMNPENSFFTMNGTLLAGDDPRYANTFGYVSIFALHQYWLPMAVLTPLYALFPQPPMHLF